MTESTRDKPIPEEKKKLVAEIAEKMKRSKTVLVASTKGLPASQFQKIKKKLRGTADVVVAKKSTINRAILATEMGTLQNLKDSVGADICLMFSDIEAFELSGVLADNQSPAKAKVGDLSPEDIEIEPGPTELIPGPAISELGAVGLKVKVEGGKLAIIKGATIVREGEEINSKVADVMGKLNILPMKVGFIPIAAYDAKADTIYTEIKIDKEGALENLREAMSKSLGFAVGLAYTVKETISYLIGKAGLEEKALSGKVSEGGDEKKEEAKPAEETKTEDKDDEKSNEERPAEKGDNGNNENTDNNENGNNNEKEGK